MEKRKPFYIHRHVGPGPWHKRKPRGFTALITPLGNGYSNIQITFCSSQDVWTKKEGRLNAEAKESFGIKNERLPALLASCEYIVLHGKLKDCNDLNEIYPWRYVLKYVD
jgi:hypothetical protein